MAKATAKTKEVATVKKAAPPAKQEDLTAAMAGDANRGFENVSATDMAIPFIVILQALSPQVKRGDQQVEGAKEGDIFNTVTGSMFPGDEGIYFIPATFKKAVVEWRPRDDGGGFVAQHDDISGLTGLSKDDNGRIITADGNILVDTAYHYGLLVDPVTNDYSTVVISMTSTQLKKSRKWNSLMAGLKMSKADGSKFTPPMFGHMYKLTTVPEENAVGSWSGWDIELFGQTPSIELYTAAKLFADNITKGLIKVAPPAPDTSDPVPF